jgi:hypothetical protein
MKPGPRPADAIVNWGMCRRCLRHKLVSLAAARGPSLSDTGLEQAREADAGQVKQRTAA